MEKKRACIHCHRLFALVRNPQQQFCSHRLCQNVRKSNWYRAKHKQDSDYRGNQSQACKRWRKKNPNYWKQYRATHPDYTDSNRQKQKQHKQMRRKKPLCSETSQFANSDALSEKNSIKTGIYHLMPLTYSGFANSDALIVKISIITNGYSYYK
jgi:hypothetical protein